MSKLIKWSGSKNSQSSDIIKNIPKILDRYYEPFVGGGSIFLNLLENDEYKINLYEISDFNEDLIKIYQMVKDDPSNLISKYKEHYIEFNKKEMAHRKEYFNKVRDLYNKDHNAFDFYWIMRTTTNGMPRYNLSGNFNNSCHFTRPGMHYDTVEKIVMKYSKLFNENNIKFFHRSYDDIKIETKEKSIFYLDPPYENTKGMYFSKFDNVKFINWVNDLNINWILSYDGKVNEKVSEHSFPKYKSHEYLKAGNSSFRRTLTGDKDSMVYESIYMNF